MTQRNNRNATLDANTADDQFVAGVLARWARFKDHGIPEDLSNDERADILVEIQEARTKLGIRKGRIDAQLADRNMRMAGKRVGSYTYHEWRAGAVQEITEICAMLGHLKAFRAAMTPTTQVSEIAFRAPQAWEYVIVDGTDEMIEETLNEMGAMGWELCAALAGARLFMKRGYDA